MSSEHDQHVRELLDALDKTQARAERAERLLFGDHASIREVLQSIVRGSGNLDGHWASRLLAQALREEMGDAPNFLVVTFDTPDGKVLVTLRRANGTSPDELLAKLKDENDRLRAALAELQG